MASKDAQAGQVHESCAECEQKRPHAVSVELRAVPSKREDAGVTREPHRLLECEACGYTAQSRMNNA